MTEEMKKEFINQISESAFEKMKGRSFGFFNFIGELEYELCRRAYEHTKGNISMAARILGLQRSTMSMRLQMHGITRGYNNKTHG